VGALCTSAGSLVRRSSVIVHKFLKRLKRSARVVFRVLVGYEGNSAVGFAGSHRTVVALKVG
jgi:hypothetical protein